MAASGFTAGSDAMGAPVAIILSVGFMGMAAMESAAMGFAGMLGDIGAVAMGLAGIGLVAIGVEGAWSEFGAV
jgi:hypothetical protein